MLGASILLLLIILVGLLLKFLHRDDDTACTVKPEIKATETTPEDTPEAAPHGEFCCHRHAICTKPRSDANPLHLYYDDEELDRFAGRDAHSYSADELDEFEDVMLTMRPDDYVDWTLALQARNIAFPAALRDQLNMLYLDAQNKNS